MKKLTSIFTVIWLITLTSLGQKSNVEIRQIAGVSYYYVDIDKAVDTVDFDIKQIIDSARIVLLDNNKDALIGSISRIGISPNFITIFPNSIGERLKLFNRNGRFIQNIGSTGRGPNEYRYLNGLQISEDNDQIICEPANLKVYYRFNFKGESLNPIPRYIFGDHLFYPINKSEVLDFGYPNFSFQGGETSKINLILSNETGKIVFDKSPVKEIYQTKIGGSQVPLMLYPFNKEYRIHFGQDTLFSFDPSKKRLSVTSIFTSGKNGYNYKEMSIFKKNNQYNIISASLIGKIHIEVLCETPDFILLKAFKREKYIDGTDFAREMGNYVLDKKSRMVHAVRFIDSFYDLNLNKKLYSTTLYPWQFYDNRYGVSAFQAIDLKKEISRILKDKKAYPLIITKMTKIDESLDIVESNIVLFIYYLKQPK